MQAFECTGLWWLPEGETPPVAGTLRVSPGGDLSLALIGSLGAPVWPIGTKQHRIILGSVDQSPAGNNLTLTSCLVNRFRTGSFAGVREEYHVGRGFFGDHLQQETDFRFRRLSLQVEG